MDFSPLQLWGATKSEDQEPDLDPFVELNFVEDDEPEVTGSICLGCGLLKTQLTVALLSSSGHSVCQSCYSQAKEKISGAYQKISRNNGLRKYYLTTNDWEMLVSEKLLHVQQVQSTVGGRSNKMSLVWKFQLALAALAKPVCWWQERMLSINTRIDQDEASLGRKVENVIELQVSAREALEPIERFIGEKRGEDIESLVENADGIKKLWSREYELFEQLWKRNSLHRHRVGVNCPLAKRTKSKKRGREQGCDKKEPEAKRQSLVTHVCEFKRDEESGSELHVCLGCGSKQSILEI